MRARVPHCRATRLVVTALLLALISASEVNATTREVNAREVNVTTRDANATAHANTAREVNATTHSTTRQREWVWWGDSLTKGSGGNGVTAPATLATLAGITVHSRGFGGETSTRIATRATAPTGEGLKHRADAVIIWIGRNNAAATDTIIADTLAIVRHRADARAPWFVLSLINGGSAYGRGTPVHDHVLRTNTALQITFRSHYIDVRACLIASGLAIAKRTPTPLDELDLAADAIPASLRSDTVHLNAAGYRAAGICVYRGILKADPRAFTR